MYCNDIFLTCLYNGGRFLCAITLSLTADCLRNTSEYSVKNSLDYCKAPVHDTINGLQLLNKVPLNLVSKK